MVHIHLSYGGKELNLSMINVTSQLTLDFSNVKDLETKSAHVSYRRIKIVSRVHYIMEDAKKMFLKQ